VTAISCRVIAWALSDVKQIRAREGGEGKGEVHPRYHYSIARKSEWKKVGQMEGWGEGKKKKKREGKREIQHLPTTSCDFFRHKKLKKP